MIAPLVSAPSTPLVVSSVLSSRFFHSLHGSPPLDSQSYRAPSGYDGTYMRRYYVARKGDQIIIAQLAEQGADYLRKEGYELASKPFDTREQADAEKQAWLERLKKLQQLERDGDP